jgi:hypothetical protein
MTFLQMTAGAPWQNALRVGGLFALHMGADYRLASGKSDGLRIAHMVFAKGESFIYGALLVPTSHFKKKDLPDVDLS